jgi:CspA family cold shock protein
MAEGVVKWFNGEKGYGYLTVLAYAAGDIPVGNHDVFVHYTEIQSRGYRTLDEGEYVSFAIERGTKGFIARRVLQFGGPPPSYPTTPPRSVKRSPRVVFLLVCLFVALITSIILIAVVGLP